MIPLARLLAKRLATSLIVLIGVSMPIFAIARIIPGDPARIALGPNAPPNRSPIGGLPCISTIISSSGTVISSPTLPGAISVFLSTPTDR